MGLMINSTWGLGPEISALSDRSYVKMLRSCGWLSRQAGADGSVSLTAFSNYLYSTKREVAEWQEAGAIEIIDNRVFLNTDNLRIWRNKPTMRPKPSESWTYFIGGDIGPIKIGSTAGDPEKRLKDLQTGSPQPLRVLGVIPGAENEPELHGRFADFRLHGEWFDRDAPGLLELVAEYPVQ